MAGFAQYRVGTESAHTVYFRFGDHDAASQTISRKTWGITPTVTADPGEHLETIGGEMVGPDDLVFDNAGNLYVTVFTENRVSMREPNGPMRILQGDIFGSDPITFHDGHLIASECRPDEARGPAVRRRLQGPGSAGRARGS